jgi:hypothetical protein
VRGQSKSKNRGLVAIGVGTYGQHSVRIAVFAGAAGDRHVHDRAGILSTDCSLNQTWPSGRIATASHNQSSTVIAVQSCGAEPTTLLLLSWAIRM